MGCFGPHHSIVLLPFCLTCRLGDGVTFFEKWRAGLVLNAFRFGGVHINWNIRAKANATNKIIAYKPVPKHRAPVQLFEPSLTNHHHGLEAQFPKADSRVQIADRTVLGRTSALRLSNSRDE